MNDSKNIIVFGASLNLQRRVSLTRLIDDEEGLSLFLSEEIDKQRNIRFLFKNVYGYRNFDEGDLVEYWSDLGGYPEHVCFQVTESNFLEWAKQQSPYKEYPEGVKHFTVITSNDVIDILSYDDPIITFE